MTPHALRELPRVDVAPGAYHVVEDGRVLSTLLGSCVAVCLYDPIRRLIGMNHFLLARRRQTVDGSLLVSEAGRYGIHAMELLINAMLKQGAERRRLRAKAFGGGNVLGRECGKGEDFFCIGALNVRFVREFLSNEGIPVVAADLGGNIGRQIHFSPKDFTVFVKKIPSAQSRALGEQERLFWRDSLQAVGRDEPQVDIW